MTAHRTIPEVITSPDSGGRWLSSNGWAGLRVHGPDPEEYVSVYVPKDERVPLAQAVAGDEYVVVKRDDIALWEVLDRDGYRWDTSATEDRAREQADRIGGTAIPLYRKAGL